MRPSKDQYYLDIAAAVAKRSTCIKSNYGAVIVNNDEIISTGYNGAPRGELSCLELGICERLEKGIPFGERYELCKSVHAEQNAIISASRKEMIGSTIYLYKIKKGEICYNCKPCDLCKRFIKNAGIIRVVSLGLFCEDGKDVILPIEQEI